MWHADYMIFKLQRSCYRAKRKRTIFWEKFRESIREWISIQNMVCGMDAHVNRTFFDRNHASPCLAKCNISPPCTAVDRCKCVEYSSNSGKKCRAAIAFWS